jgi:hypothetical protein
MWDDDVKLLKERFPIDKRCRIRRVEMSHHGSCEINHNGFITITVAKGGSAPEARDTLMHEYAHAIWYDRYGEFGPRKEEDRTMVQRLLDESWEFHAVIDRLNFPRGLSLRWADMKHEDGSVILGDTGRVTVTLRNGMSRAEEECEFVRRMAQAVDTARYKDHDPEWGVIFSEVYRVLVEEEEL